MPPKITTTFIIDGKQAISELNRIDAILQKTSMDIDKVNIRASSGFNSQGNALKGLALRFVGYNLVLNQVMGAQQKVIQYVDESVKKFREFQTRIAEVSTIMTGDYGPALTAMQSGIVALSLETGQATSDLTKGLYDIMSAAFDAQDAMNLLNTATKASIAGLSDVRTSVDIFTTVLNSYGMSAYEATKVSDTLFQSVVRGKFQFQDLESALGYVVPIASQAGITFDELMAALSTTTRHGLHLDMAARGLALALQNIINPSAQAQKAAEKYGIELSGLALRVKGIQGVFAEMNEKTKEYGKIVLNELVPNMRSLRVAMVLAGEEGLSGLLDDMDRLSVSAGRTEEAFNKIKDTSQFASNQIQQQWEKTQRDVGEAWDKMVLGMQQTITNFVSMYGKGTTLIPIIGPIISAADEVTKKAGASADKFKLMKQYLGETYIPKLQGGSSAYPGGVEGFIGRQLPWAKEMREKYPGAEWYKKPLTNEEVLTNYLDLQEEIAKTAEKINTQYMTGNEDLEQTVAHLDNLNVVSSMLQDQFNRIFGEPILGGVRNLQELQTTLEEISFNVDKLHEELETPVKYGWGSMGGEIKGSLNMQMAQLKAEQELSDAKYDVKMGTIMEDYEFKTLNADMQEAVRIIREHEKVTKADTESINLMNVALRKVQIEMLELQLVGMMRRRGLTRSEERRMKALQIQAAKLRLENMKNTKAETASEYTAYEQAKQMIDEYLAQKEHESYMLKYNYDQQISDLQLTIDSEKSILHERENNWRDTTGEIIDQAKKIVTGIDALAPEVQAAIAELLGVDVAEMAENARGVAASAEASLSTKDQAILALEKISQFPNVPSDIEWMLKRLKGYRTGTEYVPQTGLALVHQGESISAAGKDTGRGITIGNVTIQVREIADIADVEKVAALLSVATNSEIINKSGKNRYGLRIG